MWSLRKLASTTIILLKNCDTWKSTCFASIFLSVLLSNFITFNILLYRWYDGRATPYMDRTRSYIFNSDGSFLNEAGWKTYSNRTSMHEIVCQTVNCFDISRCAPNFKVYIYPPTKDQAPPSITYSKMLSAIRRSNWFTENHDEACLFIPSLDTLDRDTLSAEYSYILASQLDQLPYWHQLPGKYQRPVPDHIAPSETSLQPGLNHLIFNFYSGTWPEYREDDHHLSLGYAMLAKTSFSTATYRPNFDISFPLIHPVHREKNALASCFRLNPGNHSCHRSTFLQHRPILLSFKGKRYVSGIGSVTRNSLNVLQNGHDIILLTTCRHGSDWVRFADQRCTADQAEYDKYDYNELLRNSTFCLIPRGRRLGSYRFLEVLQAGCIPVVLSNDWILPFSDVIDWRRAAVRVDERLLLTLPTVLRRISHLKVVQFRQQVAFLWNTYFSSVDSIVLTTLEGTTQLWVLGQRKVTCVSDPGVTWLGDSLAAISCCKLDSLCDEMSWKLPAVYELGWTNSPIIRDRIAGRLRGYTAWNSPPGGLILSHSDSLDRCDLPVPRLPAYCNTCKSLLCSEALFSNLMFSSTMPLMYGILASHFSRFTMVVPIRDHLCKEYRNRLVAYAQSVLRSPSLDKVLLIWQCPTSPPNSVELPGTLVRFEIILPDERRQEGGDPSRPFTGVFYSPSSRFEAFDEINTSAVFTFSLNVNLTAEQVEFAFTVWRQFPHRLVGFQGHGHYWDQPSGQWHYSTNITENRQQATSYSLILLNAAFYHRYYHHLYWRLVPKKLLDVVDIFSDCEDLLLNALIGHVTQSPPLKMLSVRQTDHLIWSSSGGGYHSHRSTCLQAISQHMVDSVDTVPASVFYSACQCDLEVSPAGNRTPVVVHSPSGLTAPPNYLYLPLFQSSLV